MLTRMTEVGEPVEREAGCENASWTGKQLEERGHWGVGAQEAGCKMHVGRDNSREGGRRGGGGGVHWFRGQDSAGAQTGREGGGWRLAAIYGGSETR